MRPCIPTPLAAAIEAAGVRRHEIAAELGLGREFVNAMIRLDVTIPEQHIPALARLLKVEPDGVRAMGLHPVPLKARRLLAERGISSDELPQLLGISAYRVRTGLSGQRPLSRAVHQRLGELIGLPVELVVEPDTELVDA